MCDVQKRYSKVLISLTILVAEELQMGDVFAPRLLDNARPGGVETSPRLHREVYRLLRYGTALPGTKHSENFMVRLHEYHYRHIFCRKHY